jgi:hypothetical protein
MRPIVAAAVYIQEVVSEFGEHRSIREGWTAAAIAQRQPNPCRTVTNAPLAVGLRAFVERGLGESVRARQAVARAVLPPVLGSTAAECAPNHRSKRRLPFHHGSPCVPAGQSCEQQRRSPLKQQPCQLAKLSIDGADA